MKKITQLLTALVICSLMIFASCGGDGGGDKVKPIEDAGNNLVALTTNVAPTAKLGTETRDEWSTFRIAFTFDGESGGSYTVTGIPTQDGADAVWGAEGETGTWAFVEDDLTRINASGIDDEITAAITDGAVTLSFTVAGSTTRSEVFVGDWSFAW